MRSILSERNIVVVLFVMVLITFSLAHEDTKKMEQIYYGVNSSTTAVLQELSETPVSSEKISFSPKQ